MSDEHDRVASLDAMTQQERAAAEEAQARLAAIVESTDDAIISKDLQGTILTWNAAAERLLGYRADEVVGQPIHLIIPPDRRHEEAEILQRVRAGQRVDHFETLRVTKSRVLIEVSITVSPVHGRDGRITGASKILRDITRQKQAEQALRDLNARLVEADRRKDEFLAMLSHELRNPLAPISNSLLLLDHAEPGGEQARRAREVMKRQVANLSRIVDDLLDVVRLNRRKFELRRAELDLGEVARRTGEDHRGLMEGGGIDFVVATPQGPVPIDADEVRLGQVLGNLLRNAAKFTDPGGRVVLAVGAEDGSAVIRVRDTGSGINRDLLGAIFEPFTQEKQPLARTRGGLGLGLVMVKGLVELHGGTVTAASEGPGRGSEFTVRLPLTASSRASSSHDVAQGASPARRQARVLVVDDNVDAADTLAELLEVLGHEVHVAYDGPGAIEKVRSNRPDVVLCDIGLPGMDGYEVARILRSGGGDRMRLVALSGYAQPDDVKKAVEAGFDAHLAKPADPRKLEQLLVGGRASV